MQAVLSAPDATTVAARPRQLSVRPLAPTLARPGPGRRAVTAAATYKVKSGLSIACPAMKCAWQWRAACRWQGLHRLLQASLEQHAGAVGQQLQKGWGRLPSALQVTFRFPDGDEKVVECPDDTYILDAGQPCG